MGFRYPGRQFQNKRISLAEYKASITNLTTS